jgi:hypothetical protein
MRCSAESNTGSARTRTGRTTDPNTLIRPLGLAQRNDAATDDDLDVGAGELPLEPDAAAAGRQLADDGRCGEHESARYWSGAAPFPACSYRQGERDDR